MQCKCRDRLRRVVLLHKGCLGPVSDHYVPHIVNIPFVKLPHSQMAKNRIDNRSFWVNVLHPMDRS